MVDVVEKIKGLPDANRDRDANIYIYNYPTVEQEQNGISGHWPADITIADLKALAAEHERMREAIETSIQALDDWLCDFADTECDPQAVEDARKRIREHGTIWYIATVQEKNRKALGTNI